jgi:exosome complex component CSL4
MIVFPGDEVGYSEEYLCGKGCYESDGKIKASVFGELTLDNENKLVEVKPLNGEPTILKPGDIVFGRISDLRSNMAIVEVVAKEGKEKKSLSTMKNATLFVSQISSSYVKDTSEAFRIGDVIKAKVLQVKPSLQLTVKDEDLGVVKAFCRKCKSPMRVVGSRLQCFRCRIFDNRIKLSKDYCKPIGIKVME